MRNVHLNAQARPFLVIAVLLGAIPSCGREPAISPNADTTGPTVVVRSPAQGAYDDNADGLLDLRVEWHDSTGIDTSSIEVSSLRPLSGPVKYPNLLQLWDRVTVSPTGFWLRERKENMLPHGDNVLEISVKDLRGNLSRDTVRFSLPYAAQTKTILSDIGENGQMVKGTYCPDDNRVYMTAASQVLVIDADSLAPVRHFTAAPFAQANNVLCIPGDPFVYVTGLRVHAYHRGTYVPAFDIAESFASRAITRSAANSDLIYVGEDFVATAGIVRRSTRTRIGDIGVPWSTWPKDIATSLIVTPGDSKLYLSRADEGGILVIDPAAKRIVTRIRFVNEPGNPQEFGRSDDMKISSDSLTIYAAVLDGVPRGIARIDVRTDRITQSLALSGRAEELGLSPDETRLFVTTQDLGAEPSRNYLVDIREWRILQEFPRPRAPGEIRLDGPVVFHPSGRWFFVGLGLNVVVYLNRE